MRRSGLHRPFTEHRHVPAVSIDPGDNRPKWPQAADAFRAAIASGLLGPGDAIPSVRELAAGNRIPVATLQRGLAQLAAEGLLTVRQGRRTVVSGQARPAVSRRQRPAGTGHDCQGAGCRPHQCRPLSAGTIRQIHAIPSGAFAAAVRWEMIDRNPVGSARLPRARPRSLVSPPPAAVASVISTAYLRVQRRPAGLRSVEP
jgi:DNA-binding transcriptional regulator YhcF (GntR family)